MAPNMKTSPSPPTESPQAAPGLEFFEDLGQRVLRRWSGRAFALESFPDIASHALSETPPASFLDWKDALRWVASADRLPAQDDPDSAFGEPPLSLFQHPKFTIQMLFWLDRTTSIHNHAFSGALSVLHGSSIHSLYDFHCEDEVSEDLRFGILEDRSIEALSIGDVRPIRSGESMIHGLFHLERPSVTVVVRTHGGEGPQFDYLRPNLACTPRPDHDIHLKRKLESLALLLRLGERETHRRLLEAMTAGADFSTLFWLLRGYASKETDADWEVLAGEILERARATQGSRVDSLIPIFREETRFQTVAQRRFHVSPHPLRFFLALLLNAPRPERIRSLIAERFPAEPAVVQIVRWVRELWQIPVRDEGNPLGIECDDDTREAALLILELLLSGQSADEIAARRSDLQGVHEVAEIWRSHLVLAPLFAADSSMAPALSAV